MAQLDRLKEYGLNPKEWKRARSIQAGQLYFFIWDTPGFLIAGFYRASWDFPLEKNKKNRDGVAFVRI